MLYNISISNVNPNCWDELEVSILTLLNLSEQDKSTICDIFLSQGFFVLINKADEGNANE